MVGPEHQPTRRALLSGTFALVALAGAGLIVRNAGGKTIVGTPGSVDIAHFADSGEALGIRTVDKVIKSEEAWIEQLSDLAFRVTRQEGTEGAFTGPHLDTHEAGIFRCICCDTALFGSDAKFDSRTGWPSFWQTIAGQNIVEHADHSFGMTRTGLSCARCDAHLGHVFADGPPPTGLRYCINGVALRFVPLATA
jgi:peptide-methionine (R)-S-oxide reductase